MTSVGVAKREFELTEKSLTDDIEIRKAIIFDVPNGFVENFVLRRQGEFCISKALDGHFYLSVFVDYNKTTKEEAHVIHLRIEADDDETKIEGMLFARAKTLGALIYNLAKKNTVEFLAGVLEKDVKMEHLVGISAAEANNVYVKKTITDKNILAQTYHTIIYSGRMEFADGKTRGAMFEETRKYESKEEFLKKFFDELVTGAEFISNKLPIRLPIGAILQPPTLIYSQKLLDVGFSLDYVLKYNDHQLDLTQRIKLCSSAVRIMSELHHADVFHGAVKPENFYAEYVGTKNNIKQYELMFNGATGLLFHDQSDNTIEMVDYDLIAPELAFTRKLTKESGVFNMGRLFEQILKTEILKTYNMKPEEEPRALHEMRQLIQRATRPNPQQRPTMAGVVMMIREVLVALPPTTASVNFVHFDQFAD